uniref:Uncharacterized protein n=1 Tax=Rhizobium phage IG49 TaxID=3129228 RepID=A0AAU8HZ93_9CAUD
MTTLEHSRSSNYNLISDIRKEIDDGWSKGRTLYRYRVPASGVPTLISDLLDGSTIPSVEVISLRLAQFNKPQYPLTTKFNVFETSDYRIRPGTDKMVIFDGANEIMLEDILAIKTQAASHVVVLIFEWS